MITFITKKGIHGYFAHLILLGMEKLTHIALLTEVEYSLDKYTEML
jgi:hypothetical protein